MSRHNIKPPFDTIYEALLNISFPEQKQEYVYQALRAAIISILEVANSMSTYKDSSVSEGTSGMVYHHLTTARLRAKGFVPISEDLAHDLTAITPEWGKDMRLLDIQVEKHGERFWGEDWMTDAIKIFIQNNGYAGMKFQKFMRQIMAAQNGVVDNRAYARPPKNAPPHVRRQGYQPETEEEEYNVKRKVRHKAPRMKRGMGRI